VLLLGCLSGCHIQQVNQYIVSVILLGQCAVGMARSDRIHVIAAVCNTYVCVSKCMAVSIMLIT